MKDTKITTPDQLRDAIDRAYPTRRAFIEAFNAAGGCLNDETILSNQLRGERGLSVAWLSAYNIFFTFLKKNNGTRIKKSTS